MFNWLKKLLFPRMSVPQEEIGRNDLCWCGSNKKYKRCHLDEDAKKKSAQLASTQHVQGMKRMKQRFGG
jgi:hypothetical protein